MNSPLNMIIVGLAGQGVVMASRIISTALLMAGEKVMTTEVPATSHRFSLNWACVRSAPDVLHSAKISPGEANLMLGLEPIECLKVAILYAHKDGIVLINDRPIETRVMRSQATEKFPYPSNEKIVELLATHGIKNIKFLKASEIAIEQAGSMRAANMVMLGAGWATGSIPVEMETLETAIRQLVPKGSEDNNIQAFKQGAEAQETARAM
jgi:indolepyruvate ferredoxin oxidoreductase beta subunit